MSLFSYFQCPSSPVHQRRNQRSCKLFKADLLNNFGLVQLNKITVLDPEVRPRECLTQSWKKWQIIIIIMSLFSYFQCPSSPVHQRRNQRSWRIHISGKSMYSLYCSQFNTEFLQWMSIHYGSTYHNCHTELLCDPLGQHHCKDHSQLYSPSPDSILKEFGVHCIVADLKFRTF